MEFLKIMLNNLDTLGIEYFPTFESFLTESVSDLSQNLLETIENFSALTLTLSGFNSQSSNLYHLN